jgi:hypothetical protein
MVDVVRLEDGILVEHWDVIQDKPTCETSTIGLPMFGEKFPGPGTVALSRKDAKKTYSEQVQITRDIKSALQGERLRANQ